MWGISYETLSKLLNLTMPQWSPYYYLALMWHICYNGWMNTVKVLASCWTFCGFWQTYNALYPSLITAPHRTVSLLNKSPMLYLFIPPSLVSNSRWLLIFFTISAVLPYPECHIVGSIQYVGVFFLDSLLLVRDMHLSFLHILSWLYSLFLFIEDCNF